jgi:hypothetical protein
MLEKQDDLSFILSKILRKRFMNNDVNASGIGDAELLAYLDGEADSDVAAQIEGSEIYLKRAQELAKLTNRLTAQLYRLACPDSLELGEYHLGMLTREQTLVIETHLAECPHCSRELAQLSEFMVEEQPEPGPGLPEKVKVLVARLISDIAGEISPGEMAPVPVFAVRGEEGETRVYEADGIQISIDVLDDGEHPGMKVLLGLITGISAEGFEVQLLSNREQVASTEVDDLGNFELPGPPAAEYEILIKGTGVEVHIPAIRV